MRLPPRPPLSAASAGLVLLSLLLACGDEAPAAVTAPPTPTTPSPETVCDGAKRLVLPDDFSARGPWAVGARTVQVGGLTSEIWYPAEASTALGKDTVTYDIRKQLPPDEMGKISDEKNPLQACACVRDLPLDEAHGPYPVVVFFHGTAAFRTQSVAQMTHWASRGFVVVATDHPKLYLADALKSDIAFDGPFPANSALVLDAIKGSEEPVRFLSGHVDFDKIASSGHSAGGGAAVRWSYPGTKVKMPLSAGGTEVAPGLVSTLVMGGDQDKLVPATQQKKGYDASPTKKRLVLLKGAGHLAFSDICSLGRENGGILQIALDAGVRVPKFLTALAVDGCADGQLFGEKADRVVNAITAATLEETLACSAGAEAALRNIGGAYPAEIAGYEEGL